MEHAHIVATLRAAGVKRAIDPLRLPRPTDPTPAEQRLTIADVRSTLLGGG